MLEIYHPDRIQGGKLIAKQKTEQFVGIIWYEYQVKLLKLKLSRICFRQLTVYNKRLQICWKGG
jgi:hypothetical protein